MLHSSVHNSRLGHTTQCLCSVVCCVLCMLSTIHDCHLVRGFEVEQKRELGQWQKFQLQNILSKLKKKIIYLAEFC